MLVSAPMDAPSTLKPEEVAFGMIQTGIAKHRERYDVVFMKAFAAGVMLSIGGFLSLIMSTGSGGLNQTNPGIVKILSGAVFPVGLIMIYLQQQELLTSNMLYFPMAVVKRAIPWWSLVVNWVIVFFGNLVGSVFYAAILVKYTGLVSAEPYLTGIKAFAIHKAGDPQWHQIFLRGIGCNWLVCVAIWQASAARETISKILSIWLPIFVFVALGYDHVVANMFSVPLGIMLGAKLTTAEYIRKSLFAALFGNIVGALFVALPACHYYLRDYDAGGLEHAETGQALRVNEHASNGSSDDEIKHR